MANWEARTVPAADKIEINRVGEFTTTTLSGEPFTQEDLGHVLLFAFVDPASEDAGAFYDAMTAAWDGVQEAGAGMVLCLKGEDERGQFADAPFPVILYNDSLKEALGNNSGMVEDKDVPNTASWYVNGSFLSAWALVLDAEELPEDAAAFAKVSGQGRQRKLRSGQQRSICHEPYGLSRHEKDDHALPAGSPADDGLRPMAGRGGEPSSPRGSICAWSVWALAENKHRWKIQLGAALASNPFLMNFLHGRISRTGLKAVCVPGLNCYSCPAAAASCPIGALQAVIGSSKFQFAWYVVGFLIFAGALLGRVVCGFLCPFGWFQELLHKIPAKKFSTRRVRILTYLKYGILALFVIVLPMTVVNASGNGGPLFLQIPLSRRDLGGRNPSVPGRHRHPGQLWAGSFT